MRRELAEEPLILISIVKWFILATIVGFIGGLSSTIFIKSLEFAVSKVSSFSRYYLLLPVALFVSSFIVKTLAKNQDLTTEKVIEDIHKREGKINLLTIPAAFISTIITVAFGGSAGKEAPCADISAGLSSGLARLFKFNARDRKRLVICGISAGFSAVFGTPIAGALFSVEVLYVGNMLYTVLFPAFVSGIIGYEVANFFGVSYFHFGFEFLPGYTRHLMIKSIISGIFFGLIALLLVLTLKGVKRIRKKIRLKAPYHSVIGGIMLLLIVWLFSDMYLGLGLRETEQILKGLAVPLYAFIIKILVTAITLNFGGRGGLITPMFFIGASSGVLIADILGMDQSMAAAMGMISLLAAAANTPIAASVLAIELFSPDFAAYFAISAVVAYVTIGHNSIYPSQVLLFSKAESIYIEAHKGIDEQRRIRYLTQSKGLVGMLYHSILKKILRR